MTTAETTAEDRSLVLSRFIDAPPAALFRCWTEPSLMVRWFTPAPWSTTHAETDVRPGGSSLVVMCDPDGNEYANRGIYLEVVPDERLVFTDAYVSAWEPSAKPFMTVIVTFEPEGSGTRYTARALHWTKEDRDAHAAMGFEEGWGKAADQLAALAATL